MTSNNLSRRDFLKISAASLAALTLTSLTDEQPPIPAALALWKGSPNQPVAALTYDDCYLSFVMVKLEELLWEYPKVKVTLFPVGETFESNQAKEPDIWKRFYTAGHEFGYHSFYHIGPNVQPTQVVLDDYDRWLEACTKVLGYEPRVRFARPPFGLVSQSFIEMCQARNLIPTMWSTGWGGPYENAASAIRDTSNGDIVLLHTRIEDIDNTRQALQDLNGNDLRFVTMSELYYAYLMDKNGFSDCDTTTAARLRTCPD